MSKLSTDVKHVLAACAADTEVAGRVLFPGRFFRPFDAVHKKIFDKIDSSTSQQVAIAAPRGLGKTSISNLLLPAKNILFADANYIVPVSSTATQAEQQSENLKRELMSNNYVRSIYGDIRTKTFSKTQWVVNVAGNEICVMPRGSGQQIRGLLFRNSRPDLIIVDDLESAEGVRSEEQREKLREWFFADLMNSVDRGKDDWRIIVVGTVLHQKALLVELLDSPDWDSEIISICDDDLKSNAPNFMSDEAVKRLYFEYKNLGKIDTFYREYRNIPVPTGEDAVFQPDKLFKYYEEKDFKLSQDPNVENILIVDPAKTTKVHSAETGFVLCGVNMLNDAIFVRKAKGEKLHPQEIYDRISEYIMFYNVQVLGIEVTSLHEFILHPLKNELARRGLRVEIVELHARGGAGEKGKEARIKQLLHYYEAGLIYHNKEGTTQLEAQLVSFPRPARWDVMDAFGYIPEILESGQRYMKGYTGEMDARKIVEAEMEEVMAYDPLEPVSDWRPL